MCGVFGAVLPGGEPTEAAAIATLGLFALQHRGQESAGIAVSDGEQLMLYKDLGMIGSVLEPREVMARTLEGVGRLVANQAACIYLIEGEQAIRAACVGDEALMPDEKLPISEPPILQILDGGEPPPIPDVMLKVYLQDAKS